VRVRDLAPVAVISLGALAPALAVAQETGSACVACHGNADFFEEEALQVVARFEKDVHAAVGLSCHDCHGGNPDPALAEDLDSMDDAFPGNPYRGAPDKAAIPELCGGCHSDIEYMRRFAPRARVDQLQEYWTSHHGRGLRAGDERVATCSDCHGAHGILGPGEPASPVHPRRVAETCAGCHADAALMQGSTLPDGSPLPVDQHARWRLSVHAEALFEREDLSAPTCNDCHGNHGATPPGVQSVSFVCGQCHGREAEIFRGSAKWRGFESHNELLAEAGPDGCEACHEELPAGAKAAVPTTFTECSTCHDHHAVVRPGLAMLTPLPEAPCAFCHEPPGGDEGGPLEPERGRELYASVKAALLAQAASSDFSGDDLYDWLVDRARELPQHTLPGGTEDVRVRKPEFERLWSKFRLGKVSFSYPDPATGEPVQAKVVRCGSCHPAGGTGLATASRLVSRIRELTARTAAAERVLLQARRGGVEIRGAELEVDHAVDAQIGLQVAVHGFSSEPDPSFEEVYTQGLERARAALEAGRAALEELAFRRLGLAVSLVFVVLVLVALALKIRQLPG
jgi:hypothetical protein